MNIVTRQQALQSGLKQYYTGKPCKFGHLSNRSIWGGCRECDKIGHRNRPDNRNKLKKSTRSKLWWKTINRAHRMILKQRGRAKNRGLEFSITEKDINPLPTHCLILGIELNYYGSKLNRATASIDRIDNSKGYISGNVHVISALANRIKGEATIAEIENMLRYMKDSNAR